MVFKCRNNRRESTWMTLMFYLQVQGDYCDGALLNLTLNIASKITREKCEELIEYRIPEMACDKGLCRRP